MPLEEVEKLMQDNADAREYEQSLRQLLGAPRLLGCAMRSAGGRQRGGMHTLVAHTGAAGPCREMRSRGRCGGHVGGKHMLAARPRCACGQFAGVRSCRCAAAGPPCNDV